MSQFPLCVFILCCVIFACVFGPILTQLTSFFCLSLSPFLSHNIFCHNLFVTIWQFCFSLWPNQSILQQSFQALFCRGRWEWAFLLSLRWRRHRGAFDSSTGPHSSLMLECVILWQLIQTEIDRAEFLKRPRQSTSERAGVGFSIFSSSPTIRLCRGRGGEADSFVFQGTVSIHLASTGNG